MRLFLLGLAVLLFRPALAQEYTFVTYNVENLFDADGESPYDDYKALDRDGRPLYTPAHLLRKLENITAVMKKYNAGRGPDVIGFVEIEADQTPGVLVKAGDFLKKYAKTPVSTLLSSPLTPELATLPAELWLLKAFDDAGLKGYDLAVGEPPLENGKPTAAIKCVVFSRLAIQHEKTRAHPLKEARPVLEVWLKQGSAEVAVFVNHWKSGSGDAKQEAVRVENGAVLRARVDEIAVAQPSADMVFMGDFNSDFNQKSRYGFPETGINTKLAAGGDEAAAARSGARSIYNLWYELPVTARRSDAYRTEWGTLMHLMINGRLYDNSGFQYVDNSMAVGEFPGFNTLSWSGTPRRWSFAGGGSGYSDHFPLSARFKIAGKDTAGRIALVKPSVNDDAAFAPNPVQYRLPEAADVVDSAVLRDPAVRREYQFQLFKIESEVSAAYEVTVHGEAYALFSQQFDFKAALADVAGSGKKITVYGRLSQFRGKWQFLVDAPVFIVR